jgi:hypothetical protein
MRTIYLIAVLLVAILVLSLVMNGWFRCWAGCSLRGLRPYFIDNGVDSCVGAICGCLS